MQTFVQVEANHYTKILLITLIYPALYRIIKKIALYTWIHQLLTQKYNFMEFKLKHNQENWKYFLFEPLS